MIDIEALRVQLELTGENVVLVQLGMDHVDGVYAALQDPEVVRLTATHTKFTRERIEKWTSGLLGRDDRADYAILRKEDRAYLGDVSLKDLDEDNRSMSFRIALGGQAEFGRGYGTEATRLALDYAFDVVGLHRVGLEVFPFNPRAKRVYEKCGFVEEGVQREALFWDGAWHDVITMAILAGDPRG